MYNAFFGLKENPFSLSPDPSFLYRSAQHEEALANLIYGVQSHKGFVVLTGEVGTGKSTLLECLRNFLSAQNVEYAYIFNSRLTVDQFFEMLAREFDLECNHASKTSVLFALNEFLIDRSELGLTTALILDEAQNLDWEVLEEIRLLGNLETPRGKLLQMVLAGQPELDRKLDAPDYRQLKQRIALRCTLYPFEEVETSAYIHSRLARAGMVQQNVFPADLISEIHYRTQGIPRIINAVCDNLLLASFASESKSVSMEYLDEVSTDLRLDWPGRRPFRPRDEFADTAPRHEPLYTRSK